MGIGERLKGLGYYFLMALVFLFLLYMLFLPDAGKEYLERGIKTEATITSVINIGIRTGAKEYKGVYHDSNGSLIEATIIVNRAGAMVGDVVEGYILEEEPYTVWCEPSKGLNIFLKILIGFLILAIGGTLVFTPVFIIIERRKERARNRAIWEEGMKEFKEESRW